MMITIYNSPHKWVNVYDRYDGVLFLGTKKFTYRDEAKGEALEFCANHSNSRYIDTVSVRMEIE